MTSLEGSEYRCAERADAGQRRVRVSVSDRESLRFTVRSGTRRARERLLRSGCLAVWVSLTWRRTGVKNGRWYRS
jgi:hypothetical protein